MNIYILRLEGGRYYVGKSDDVMRRYQQHLDGTGASWTQKYRPIGVHKIIHNVSEFDEDKITKEYMSKYGIDKVRGGSYVEEKLSGFHKDALKMEIWNANNLCSQCGRPGHFVKDCYAKTDVYGDKIEYEIRPKNRSDCMRCGRTGHSIDDCYAKTDTRGRKIYDDEWSDSDEYSEDEYSEDEYSEDVYSD